MTTTEVQQTASQNYGSMMIKGVFSYELFGETVYITTTQITLLIVTLALVLFAFLAYRKIKKHPDEIPGTFQNILELIVEKLDGMVTGSMPGNAHRYRNYVGTVFAFILVCNLGGIFGLRSPTADFGTTLPLGLISFFIIEISAIRKQKWQYLTNFAKPYPFLIPSNIIGEISVPISLSLRLFGNILSGTMIMALWGSMVQLITLQAAITPFLHVYMDLFSGCIQAYVFSMLTMTYIQDKVG